MGHSAALPEHQTIGEDEPGRDSGTAFLCPFPTKPPALDALISNLRNDGCPLAPLMIDRLRCETLLVELSTTFVNIPASQVDSQIESALRQMVAFLGIDRSGFGEFSADRTRLVITHSNPVPGVPPSGRIIVDEQMPWYAR